jgi:hypothetical protein
MSAASATAAASAATATAAVAATAAVPAAAASFFYAGLQVRGVFLIEDKESRETDVGELFLTERDFMGRCNLLQRQIGRRAGRRGCATSHRQQPSGSQNRYRFRPLSLRSLLRLHGKSSHNFEQNVRANDQSANPDPIVKWYPRNIY